MQLFVWGAWLTTLGTYGFKYKQWTPEEFGAVFTTLGIASLIMPAIIGILADKFADGEKLYGVLHLLYGVTLLFLATTENANTFFWILLISMLFYMPTISLSNSISYRILKDFNFDVVKAFPPIRVWGTIGFIAAMWITNLFSDPSSPWAFGLEQGKNLASFFGNELYANQFYIAAIGAFFLGFYSFSLPCCPPQRLNTGASVSERLGMNAFGLFANRKLALFFIFSMFLGAALQLTNMYGDTFLKDFENVKGFEDSAVVRYSTMIISISQISETLFILAIPFFLRRFGIKKVILISMIAWVLRFGFFALGTPEGFGLGLIILSNIIYGMAFDFFNISGSLFIETTTSSKIRGSAQGLFMMMTNGFGAVLGSAVSGYVVGAFFTTPAGKDWQGIWFSFAVYALIIAVAFALLFKHKHQPDAIKEISH